MSTLKLLIKPAALKSILFFFFFFNVDFIELKKKFVWIQFVRSLFMFICKGFYFLFLGEAIIKKAKYQQLPYLFYLKKKKKTTTTTTTTSQSNN